MVHRNPALVRQIIFTECGNGDMGMCLQISTDVSIYLSFIIIVEI